MRRSGDQYVRAVEIRKRIIPIVADVDVLVVGGGPAGIGAAIAAARGRCTHRFGGTLWLSWR